MVKSEILNLRLDKEEETAVKTEFPFIWGKKELKYLGIKITPILKDLYQVNYIPLLNEIQVELKKITNCTLSWMGRINVVKMLKKHQKCYTNFKCYQ